MPREIIVALVLLGTACSDTTTNNNKCTYNGKSYQAGETFPKGDGCNTCTCSIMTPGGGGATGAFTVGCTEKACPPSDGGMNDGRKPDLPRSDGSNADRAGDALPSGIAFTTVGMGTGSAASFVAQFNQVFTDEVAWKDLLGKLAGTASASVDFSTEMILAAGLGLRGSGGYSVEVKAVGLVGGQVLVSYVETTPGEGCGATAVMTAPWHAVKIAKQVAPIRFVLKRVQAPACGTPTPVPCAAEKAAVRAELERINHCDVAADCAVAGGACPFGCYIFHHKAEGTATFQLLVKAHDAKCTPCAYDCAPPPTAAEIVCVGSTCQKLITKP